MRRLVLPHPTMALAGRLQILDAMRHSSIAALSPVRPEARSLSDRISVAAALRAGVAACALLLTACVPTRPGPPAVEFVIVRHAEKRSDEPRDPELSAAGRERAQRLAASLAAWPLAAAYATVYRRTQQTAAAADHGLAVTGYDAKQDAGEFAATLRRRHASGTVLVVGHSNTVAAIAAALCACTVAPIGEDEYHRRLRVRIDGRGQATLTDTQVP